MSDCIHIPDPGCTTKNPLLRKGTDQSDRRPDSLLPEKIKIDDRSIEEILIYAYNLSERIRYFNDKNEEEGSWERFFAFDEGSILAILSSENLLQLENKFKNVINNPNPDQASFRNAIDFIYNNQVLKLDNICRRIERLPLDFPRVHAFKMEFFKVIEEEIVGAILDNKIQNALVKLIGYDKGNFIAANRESTNDYTNFVSTNTKRDSCTLAWKINQECYDCINPDNTYTLERISELFQVIYKAMVVIQQKARAFLQIFLNQNERYLPHIALFFTFLRLFEYVREDLNDLSAKHLKFYYEKVLCLKRKPEEADRVHVIFELAKNFDQHLVTQGASLIGGKDASGKTRIYQLTDEIVVNKAQVAEIKTTFINEDLEGAPNELLQVYAAPYAKFADGLEQEFDNKEEIRWSALGGRFHSPGVPGQLARIGFAISSPLLWMNEGFRTLTLKFMFDQVIPIPVEKYDYFQNKFELVLSTEEDWLHLEERVDPIGDSPESSAYFEIKDIDPSQDGEKGKVLTITITLDKTAPAILPFAGTEEEIKFPARWPMLKVYLKNEPGIDYAYNRLRDLMLDSISISLDVQDVRNLTIANDQSILDPTKEFPPFGPIPKAGSANKQGSSFYIGHPEVYSKKLDALKINTVWSNLPDESFDQYYKEYDVVVDAAEIPGNADFQVKPYLLMEKDYKPVFSDDTTTKSLFISDENAGNDLQSQVVMKFEGEDIQRFDRQPSLLSEELQDPNRSDYGFLKMELINKDFLHEHYPKALTRKSIEMANKPNDDTIQLPNEPYTPMLSSISLDYASSLDIKFSDYSTFLSSTQGHEQVFYLLPFGYKQLEIKKEIERVETDSILLFPQFEPSVQAFNLETKQVQFQPKEIEKEDASEIPKETQHLKRQGPSIPPFQFDPTLLAKVFQFNKLGDLTTIISPIEQSPELLSLNLELFNHLGEYKTKPIALNREAETQMVTARRRTKLASGNLYIGIQELTPPQNLSVLFQVLEGAGDHRFAPPMIEWSYLVDNEWRTFSPKQITLDTTKVDAESRNSLLKSGIIRFSIPRDISKKNTTIINPAFYWIRASTIPTTNTSSLRESPAALPDLVDIRTQAAEAVFVNQGNSSEHLETALSPRSISKLLVKQAGIKKVEQPFSSFNGRLKEGDVEFFPRASERLRHKDRGVTIWDFEHLVLERFPEIFKVKCLNHAFGNVEIAPGNITLAVIPNFKDNNNLNPLEPRAHLGTLKDIEIYLRNKTNIFVGCKSHLQVLSPNYEKIRVVCCVRFKAGRDEQFYQKELNRELKQFLAPWAYDEKESIKGSEIIFGARTHRSHILNFIEERKYVDVVSRMALLHFDVQGNIVPYFDKNGKQLMPEQIEEIIPTTSLSILTSYEKKYEEIEEIPFEYDHLVLITPRDELSAGDTACPTCP